MPLPSAQTLPPRSTRPSGGRPTRPGRGLARARVAPLHLGREGGARVTNRPSSPSDRDRPGSGDRHGRSDPPPRRRAASACRRRSEPVPHPGRPSATRSSQGPPTSLARRVRGSTCTRREPVTQSRPDPPLHQALGRDGDPDPGDHPSRGRIDPRSRAPCGVRVGPERGTGDLRDLGQQPPRPCGRPRRRGRRPASPGPQEREAARRSRRTPGGPPAPRPPWPRRAAGSRPRTAPVGNLGDRVVVSSSPPPLPVNHAIASRRRPPVSACGSAHERHLTTVNGLGEGAERPGAPRDTRTEEAACGRPI